MVWMRRARLKVARVLLREDRPGRGGGVWGFLMNSLSAGEQIPPLSGPALRPQPLALSASLWAEGV